MIHHWLYLTVSMYECVDSSDADANYVNIMSLARFSCIPTSFTRNSNCFYLQLNSDGLFRSLCCVYIIYMILILQQGDN